MFFFVSLPHNPNNLKNGKKQTMDARPHFILRLDNNIMFQ